MELNNSKLLLISKVKQPVKSDKSNLPAAVEQ